MREWSSAAADEATRRWVRRTGAEAEVARTWLLRTVGPSTWSTAVLDDDAYRAGLFEGARRIGRLRDDPRWDHERWPLLLESMAEVGAPRGVRRKLARWWAGRPGPGAAAAARRAAAAARHRADDDRAARYRRGIAGAMLHAAHGRDDPPPDAEQLRGWELELLAAHRSRGSGR